MSDFELLMVILTVNNLIVAIVALCLKAKK